MAHALQLSSACFLQDRALSCLYAMECILSSTTIENLCSKTADNRWVEDGEEPTKFYR